MEMNEKFESGRFPDFVHPQKKEWMKLGDEELNELFPELSEFEQTYLEMICSKSYQDMISRLERYTGISADKLSVPQIASILFQSLMKIKSIESKHKDKLEKLALDSVLNIPEFEMVRDAYENGDVKFDIKIDEAELNFTDEDVDEEMDELEELNVDLASEFETLDELKLRRRFANLMIQGSAVLKTYLFNMISDELNKIDPKLVNLYGIAGVGAQLGYWVTPFGIERYVSSENEAGSEQVIPEDDGYIIKARGIIFPYLVHELVKGIYEWVSLDPEMKSIMAGEKIEDETMDIISGPEVFKVISSYLKPNEQNLLPLVHKKILSLPSYQIKDIIAKNPAGDKLVFNIINDARDEYNEYKASGKSKYNERVLDYYIGSVINEGMNDIKSKYVDSGKIDIDTFDRIVNSDPSKTKKYVEWMVRQVINNPSRISHIIDMVIQFNQLVLKNKIKGEESDIYRYDIESLDNIIDKYSVVKSRSEKEKEVLDKDVQVVFENDKMLIIKPLTHAASVWFKNKYITQSPTYQESCKDNEDKTWCTTRKHDSYWNQYIVRSNLYYIYMKDTKESYAVESTFGNIRAYDVLDNSIPYSKLKEMMNDRKN